LLLQSQKKISRQTLFEFGDDLISKVIINQKPEIVKSMNQDAETDLLKYYSTKTGTKSFIGIPVFLEKTVVGVLCVDSNSNDAYDENIIQLLSNFKHLCTAFISNYNEKYTLYHDRNTLLAIDKFNELITKNQDNQNTIINAIITSVSSIFHFTRIGICGYNEKGNNWNIIASNSEDHKTAKKVDTLNGLIAKTINKYEPVYAKITSETGIRLYENEPKMSKGFFVSIPIRTQKNNYGALFAEYDNNKYLNESDIKSMLNLAEYAALAIEKINVSEILANSSIIDQNNGFHNKNALLHRIQEEIIRAADFKYKLSLVLLKLDKYDAYEQHPDKLDRITDYVLATIENNLKAYDILGQTDHDVFGVLLIEGDASNAKFWAEKVRTQIANSMIEINSHRLSVTVSIGVAEFNESMNLNDFINSSKEALNISLNKTNSVTVF
jgi:diguanylate cyclase (GGDEF)-like protein